MNATTDDCTAGDRPTVGEDAVSLERFVEVETANGHLLVYDRDNQNAWIQSDLYVARGTML